MKRSPTAGPGGLPPLARRYSGFFNAVASGTYQFSVGSDDGSYLWLDGNPNPLIDDNRSVYGDGAYF